MTDIWFSSDANITDRNLAKFITLLPASNMTPFGARLLSFVTQSSLSLQGSPVENADKNSCSAFYRGHVEKRVHLLLGLPGASPRKF